MKDEKTKNDVDNLEIEPLSDEALESVAGGSSSDGPSCCSCSSCSNSTRDLQGEQPAT